VTGARDMWGDADVIRDWRAHVAARDGKYPRLVAAGNLVDGLQPVWPNSIRVGDAGDARNAVRSLQQDGADFIKVYSHLPRDAYFAIANEAKQLGITFAGHVTIAITAAEASDAGQRSIEHLTGVALGCSSLEPQIVQEVANTIASRGWAAASALERAAGALIDSTYDASRCQALPERFVRNETWQVPTLTARYNVTHLDDPVDGDPLADIHNVSRIAAVVVNGRLIDGAARERLLNDAAGASGPVDRRVAPGQVRRRRPE